MVEGHYHGNTQTLNQLHTHAHVPLQTSPLLVGYPVFIYISTTFGDIEWAPVSNVTLWQL